MSVLRITLFGSADLQYAGQETFRLTSRKGTLLLARLALPPGRKHGRQVLQEMLWPDADATISQGRLRFVLHRLRRLLDRQILSDRESIWLDGSAIETDVAQFEHHAQLGTLESLTAACALYRGELLAGYEPVGQESAEWLGAERDRLGELARDAFWHLFALHAWRGEVKSAEQIAARYLEMDSYCERMHAALLRLHFSQHRRVLAVRQHENFRNRLARDLEVEPGEKVERLVPLLRTGTLSADMRFDPAWVLGREDGSALASKPLVAVLPFRDISDDLLKSNLASALTENIISDLGKFRQLSVLGWHTSFALLTETDSNARLRQLSVRYCVDGHLQRTKGRVRVTVSLVENQTGRQVWSERYEGDPEELPLFQERVTRSIVSAIPVHVEDAEIARIRHREVADLTAYELYLAGKGHQRSSRLDSHAKAYDCFTRALERDDTLAPAYACLALSSFLGGGSRVHTHRDCVERAIPLARRAIELDPMDPQGHWTLGMFLQDKRDFKLAAHHLEQAMELSPGDAETLAYTGLETAYAGNSADGAKRAEVAAKLNPLFPPAFAEIAGKTSFAAGRYEDALFWLRQSPDRVTTNRAWLAAAAAYARRPEEASVHVRALRSTLRSNYGEERLKEIGGPIAWARGLARFKHSSDLEHYTRGLGLAGLE